MSTPSIIATLAPLAPVAEWPTLRELSPAIAQQVFRAAMDAFARPGTVHRLPPASVPARVPAVVVPLLALADIMTPIAALQSGETPVAEATERAARLVNARVVPPAEARFGLALAEPDDLSALNRGSHWSPEDGAMLFQRVASVEAGTEAGGEGAWRLTGPGVKPGAPAMLRVGGLGERFVEQRAERVSDYPAGIDVLLVSDDGAIAALPRTSSIEVI